MQFSVCLDAVFAGTDFFEGMKRTKEAGYDAFEFWCWWDKDLERVKKAKQDMGMNITTFCTRFASLVDAGQRSQYLHGLEESIKAAQFLGCRQLITQVGAELADISRAQQHQSLVEGLKQCAHRLEETGITLLIEPLNTYVDHKGYYLYLSDEAFEIVDEVGSPKVKVLFDIYHQQIMEGHLISRITRNIDKIGHFHAAGNPGRHELTTGEINYRNVFRAIDEAGYKGFVGLEYFPLEDAVKGLKDLRAELD